MPSTGPDLLDGVVLVFAGMAIVFGALVVLMGIMIALVRLFPEKGVEEEAPPEQVAPAPAEVERDVVAAISVVLSRMMASGLRRRVAAVSQEPRGDPWRLSGRRQLMEARQRVKDASGTRPSVRRRRSLESRR
ncbi:MAG: OadG family protein [Chloroflexota bacterium]